MNEEQQLPTQEQARQAFTLAASQQHVCTTLSNLKTKPPQVLILEGGLSDERLATALWYGALLNCQNHPAPCLNCQTCLQTGAKIYNDLHVYDGREGTITIDTIRSIRLLINEAPRNNGKRLIILAEAQALNKNSANALLKSLEEPCPDTVFMLLCPKRERLLPTLVSRGWVLTLAWPESGQIAPEHKIWVEYLQDFFSSGKNWFEHSAIKGAIDPALGRELILILQKSLIAAMVDKKIGGLEAIFKNVNPQKQLEIQDILAQAQDALDYMINPALTIDWALSHMFVLVQKK